MKIKEAKQVIGHLLQWQFILMGVHERDSLPAVDIDLTKYSLQDFLNANKKIEECNKRSEAARKRWQKENGTAKGKRHMTIDDRAIAAIYTCLHFDPNGDAVVLVNDRLCGVVNAKY